VNVKMPKSPQQIRTIPNRKKRMKVLASSHWIMHRFWNKYQKTKTHPKNLPPYKMVAWHNAYARMLPNHNSPLRNYGNIWTLAQEAEKRKEKRGKFKQRSIQRKLGPEWKYKNYNAGPFGSKAQRRFFDELSEQEKIPKEDLFLETLEPHERKEFDQKKKIFFKED